MIRWSCQMMVFALLVFFCSTQIPVASLFFRPRRILPRPPSVSFIELDGSAYSRVMRNVRMADASRPFSRWNDGMAMDHGIGANALDYSEPPPDPLPLSKAFSPMSAPAMSPLPSFAASLMPPTLAAPPLLPHSAETRDVPQKRMRDELLDLDGFETLKEKEQVQ